MMILITGATGFVGQACCQEVCRLGYRVRGAVRKRTDILPSGVEGIQVGEIDSKTDWKTALLGIDTVIHLAARVHVMHEQSQDALTEFLEVNLNGTTNLARQAAISGVKRFIYLSSIKVNGEYTSNTEPFNEYSVPNPQDAYANSKWQAEQALQLISQETGMEVVILRPPLVYGPKAKANFATLLKTIDLGIPLPLKKIQNSRSLIYLGNLVDAIIASVKIPAAAGQTYLLSDDEPVSTPGLIQKIAEALNRPSRVFPMPIVLMKFIAKLFGKTAAVDRLIQSLVVDSSKIRKQLAWQPPYTMSQGLQVTADWYRSNKSSGRV